jgi:hypothetical protein
MRTLFLLLVGLLLFNLGGRDRQYNMFRFYPANHGYNTVTKEAVWKIHPSLRVMEGDVKTVWIFKTPNERQDFKVKETDGILYACWRNSETKEISTCHSAIEGEFVLDSPIELGPLIDIVPGEGIIEP